MPAGTKYETSAMCTHARIPSPSRRTEIASSKSFAVSGSIVNVDQVAQVDAALERRLRRLVRLEVRRAPLLDEQPLEHVLDPRRRAEHALDRARPRPVRDDDEIAGPASPRPLRSSAIGTPGREVRLADDELPAPARPRRRRVVGECARLELRPGRKRARASKPRSRAAPSSESPSAERAISARSARTRARARRSSRRASRVPRIARQRDLLAERRAGTTAQRASPADAAEQPLEHERAADEPVRRADELHHLDLASPREDREPDRVRDQQRRRRRAGSTTAIEEDRPRSRARPGARAATVFLPYVDLVDARRRRRRRLARDRRRCTRPCFGVTSSESGSGLYGEARRSAPGSASSSARAPASFGDELRPS